MGRLTSQIPFPTPVSLPFKALAFALCANCANSLKKLRCTHAWCFMFDVSCFMHVLRSLQSIGDTCASHTDSGSSQSIRDTHPQYPILIRYAHTHRSRYAILIPNMSIINTRPSNTHICTAGDTRYSSLTYPYSFRTHAYSSLNPKAHKVMHKAHKVMHKPQRCARLCMCVQMYLDIEV